MNNLLIAPQIAEISLAKQHATRVLLYRPDFDNGMKTLALVEEENILLQELYRPDFDNGMKT